jgi:hypothetical protein
LLAVALLSGSAQFAAQATSASVEADVGRSSEMGATLPGAPTIGVASVGNAQVTIAFTAPAFTGGLAITGYGVVCDPGQITAAGSTAPIVVTGLANDTSYSCTVRATNAAGTGAPSPAVVVMPTSPVATVFAGSTNGGKRTAILLLQGGGTNCRLDTISFDAPAAEPPAGVSFPDGLFNFVTADCIPGSTLSFTLILPAPLPAGAKYWKYGPTSTEHSPHWYPLAALISGNTITYRITDGGVGDDDLAVNGVVAGVGGLGIGTVGTPLVPGALTATAGNGSVSLRWNVVVSATGYTIKRAVTRAGPYTSVSIKQASNGFVDKDIANGTTYFYSVSASNSAGESADSAQVQATPLGLVTACGVEPMTVPQTIPCPSEMAGTFVEKEVYVCSGTQWRSTGWRVTESTCTPRDFGSAAPTMF